jgi:hypothetical protein
MLGPADPVVKAVRAHQENPHRKFRISLTPVPDVPRHRPDVKRPISHIEMRNWSFDGGS